MQVTIRVSIRDISFAFAGNAFQFSPELVSKMKLGLVRLRGVDDLRL